MPIITRNFDPLRSFMTSRISRRTLIAGTAGLGAAALSRNAAAVPGSLMAPLGSAQEPASGGTLTIGTNYDTTLFDQLRSGTSPVAAGYIFESLVIRADDGSYQPWVAESWETTPDGLETTFTIRQGITFHDGTPLDANAVKWFFDRARDPEGEHAFSSSYAPVTDVIVVDDRTVTFVFSGPFAGFFETVASNFAGLISPTAYQAAGEEYGVSVVVGSGPFSFTDWVPSDSMTINRYDAYRWAPPAVADNTGPAYLDQIEVRTLPEAATAVAALESGQLDILYGTPVQDYERLRQNSEFSFLTRPRYGGALLHIELNLASEPIQDINVRRALNHAIDREGIASAVFLNIAGEAAYGYLPPHFPAHFADAKRIGYPYDPDQAKLLLEEAGYTAGDDGVRAKDGEPLALKLITFTGTEYAATAQIVQANLKDVGIELEVVANAVPATVEIAEAGDFDLYLALWGWGSADILNFFFPSTAANNYSSVNDPALDDLLDRASSAGTVEERDALFMEADRYLIEQALWVPLIFQTDLIAVRSGVQGLAFNELGDPTFPTDWWKAE